MIIMGVILLIVAGGLYYGQTRQGKKLGDIADTETLAVGTLQTMCQGVATEIGSGGFSEYSEVKGVAEIDKPVESKLTQRKCVYFRAEVIREWEEEVVSRDSKTGQTQRRTERRSEVMSDITLKPDFYVNDGTGKLLIHPEGAKIDAVKVMDEFEQEGNSAVRMDGGNLSWGRFSFSVSTGGPKRRTLGYRFRESIIPIGQQLYCLGQVTDRDGEVSMRKPDDKKSFLISIRSEEELLSSAKKAAKGLTIGAIAVGVIGLVLIIIGLLQ